MNTHMLELKRKYVEALGHSALQYLETGMDLFHRHLRSASTTSQAAMGNLATALELLLKCFIAEKNLGAVFRDIPAEVRALLSAPERIPEFFKWRAAVVDLGSDAYHTVNLEECIACYYTFFPHMKQPLLPHLAFLDGHRDAAVHSVLPALSIYELERAGYAVLQTVLSMNGDESYTYFYYTVTEEDTRFLDGFAARRVERVSLALEQGRFAVAENVPEKHVHVVNGWNTLPVRCPGCTGGAILDGYTEFSLGDDEDGPVPALDFFAVSLSCPRCGLVLHDLEELQLAGLGTVIDRSTDLDRWFAEHSGFAEWGME